MSLEQKKDIKQYCLLFSQYNENKKNSKSAVHAYNQLCSSTTVLAISLIRINHKDPCLVDINIQFFRDVEIPQSSVAVMGVLYLYKSGHETHT